MDTFFDIKAQKRSRVTKLGAQKQHRVVLRLVPPSASKQSEIMCARDKCGVFHNIGKAISGSTEYTYTCMCGHDIQQSTNQLRKVANPVYGQLNRGKFPCPRSRLRIWFRETGLAVPSLVSLLILYTNAESGAYLRYSSRIPERRPYISTSTTHHRVSPEFIGSRNCVPVAFTAESPLAQGQ